MNIRPNRPNPTSAIVLGSGMKKTAMIGAEAVPPQGMTTAGKPGAALGTAETIGGDPGPLSRLTITPASPLAIAASHVA